MSYMDKPVRGLVGVRADANPQALIGEITAAVAELRASHEADMKKHDVLLTEKTDRINGSVTALEKQLDETVKKVAALTIGGAGAKDPAVAEHAKAFDKFFRQGVDAGLQELQIKAALTTNSDPDGGYLVPSQFEEAINRVASYASVIRQLANVITVSTGDNYKILTSQGGATTGWVGETESRAATSSPTLKEISIYLGELYANPAASQRMLDDGRINVEQWLANEVGITFAEQEGAAFVTGSGTNQPRGILSYTNIANASYAWGSIGFVGTGTSAAFASTGPADVFINTYYALKAAYRGNASWVMSDATAGTARLQKDGQGNYLWRVPEGNAMVSTIMGKPVYTDDNMSAIAANSYSIAFADFKQAYQIVDKMGVRVLRDNLSSKPNVSFYTTKRVGGGIRNFEAIKLIKFI